MIVLLTAVALAKTPDDNTGWRGLTFGSPPPPDATCETASLGGFHKSKKCVLPDPALASVGRFVADGVIGWYDDVGLAEITLTFDADVDSCMALYVALREVYGGFGATPAPKVWEGKRVRVSYSDGTRATGCSIDYADVTMAAAQRRRDAAAEMKDL